MWYSHAATLGTMSQSNPSNIAKPMRFSPEEEAWLDAHLDELTAKGVITPILPHESPRYVTHLLLVLG